MALRSRAPESSPGRLGFRGFRSFDLLRALATLAAFNERGWRTGGFHPLRPGSLRAKPLPTLPRQHLGVLREVTAFFRGVLASTGHRGRVDARGQRIGGPLGLTRTAGLPSNAPCRDARRRDASRRAAKRAPKARRPGPSREGAPATRFDVRVKPAARLPRWPRASTRPRWPVDAKSPFKNHRVFSQPTEVPARQDGLGLGSQARPARRGPWLACAPSPRARPACVTRSEVDERPSDSRPSRPRIRRTASRRARPQPSLSHVR